MATLPTPADYQETIQSPKFNLSDSRLQDCEVVTNSMGLPRARAGGFAITYALEGASGKWAVRCFMRNVADRAERYEQISAHMQANSLPYIVKADYLERGIKVRNAWYPITMMEWVEGVTLEGYVYNNYQSGARIGRLCDKFVKLAKELEGAGIAHGDLSHRNILVRNENLVLVDYDGFYVPSMQGQKASELGQPSFQHPDRNLSTFDGTIDRFSAIVIFLALQSIAKSPVLWQQHSSGVEGLLFDQPDFLKPKDSAILQTVERLPGMQDYVQVFRQICLGPISNVPPIADFIKLRPLPAAAPVKRPVKQQAPAYPVLDGTDGPRLRMHVGKMVTMVGQIDDLREAKTRFGQPYLFLNYGDYKQGAATLVLWNEVLILFEAIGIDPAAYVNQWLSVTGILSEYSLRPQIVIEAPTDIKVLSGADEARRMLSGKQSTAAKPIVAATKPAAAAPVTPLTMVDTEVQKFNRLFGSSKPQGAAQVMSGGSRSIGSGVKKSKRVNRTSVGQANRSSTVSSAPRSTTRKFAQTASPVASAPSSHQAPKSATTVGNPNHKLWRLLIGFVVGMVLFALLFMMIPAAGEISEPPSSIYGIARQDLVILGIPVAHSTAVRGSVEMGTGVFAVGRSADGVWLYVVVPEIAEGWVHRDLVQVGQDVMDLEVRE